MIPFGLGISDATIKVLAVLAVVAVVVGTGWYVSNLRADLVQSQNNNIRLQEGIRDQQELLGQMREDVRKIQDINRSLQEVAQRHLADVEALSKKFSQDARGNPRDFGQLASERPQLVERLVNRASRSAARCLEIASGAPRTEQEISAKNASEINKECPAMANPNYKAPQ